MTKPQINKIGIVTIRYNPDGIITSSGFQSTLDIRSSNKLNSSLSNIKKSSKDENKIADQAKMIFANWFNIMTKIELGDNIEIIHEITNCEKYESGLVKTCSITFSYKEITL